MAKQTTEYKREFNKANYDRVALSVKKGARADLQAAAQVKGETLSKYIKTAVEAQYKADTGKEIKL